MKSRDYLIIFLVKEIGISHKGSRRHIQNKRKKMALHKLALLAVGSAKGYCE